MKPLALLADKLLGLDVWVVGSGPSLTGFDYSLLTDRPTIALNHAGTRFHPWVHLFADEILWKDYSRHQHSPGTAVVCQDGAIGQLRSAPCCFRKQLFKFRRVSQAKVRKKDEDLFVQKTVATAGVTLAWKLGARRIFLLGIDAYRTAKRYYCDESRPRREEKGKDIGDGRFQEDRHRDWVIELTSVSRFLINDYTEKWPGNGIYVIGKHSAVGCWERISLDDALSTPTVQFPTSPPFWDASWRKNVPQPAGSHCGLVVEPGSPPATGEANGGPAPDSPSLSRSDQLDDRKVGV